MNNKKNNKRTTGKLYNAHDQQFNCPTRHLQFHCMCKQIALPRRRIVVLVIQLKLCNTNLITLFLFNYWGEHSDLQKIHQIYLGNYPIFSALLLPSIHLHSETCHPCYPSKTILASSHSPAIFLTAQNTEPNASIRMQGTDMN